MQKLYFVYLFVCFIAIHSISAQLYFPPAAGQWESIDPATLGWKTEKLDELKSYLTSVDTKGFMIVKDGKIVVEYYLNDHDQEKLWYWASAGKSLTSTLIGIAEGQGKINLDAPSSTYLGQSWAAITPEQMDAIKVRNHITMTTGLNDDPMGLDCTDPACLTFKALPGSRWSYHNAPYTLLDKVIEGATGQNINAFFKSNIGDKIGMKGLYIKNGYNNVFYSRTRDMARFGLMILADGRWNGQDIISNSGYFSAMSKTSQSLNPSYGYLWWLNGKSKYMLPQSQLIFLGPLIKTGPTDMFCALGKNDQKLYVIPSQNLVVIRMGDVATDSNNSVPIKFDITLWEKLSDIMNLGISSADHEIALNKVCNYHEGTISIPTEIVPQSVSILTISGQLVQTVLRKNEFSVTLNSGTYIIVVRDLSGRRHVQKLFVP